MAELRRDLRRVHGLGPQHRPGARSRCRPSQVEVPAEFPRKRQVKPIMIGEYGAIEPVGDIDRALPRTSRRTTPSRSGSGTPTTPSTARSPGRRSASGAASTPTSRPSSTSTSSGPTGTWEITSSPESIAAYREAAQDPWFNQIHTHRLGAGGQPPRRSAARPGAPASAADPGVAVEPAARRSTNPPAVQPAPASSGYWMLGADGKVYAFGDAKHVGRSDPAGRAHRRRPGGHPDAGRATGSSTPSATSTPTATPPTSAASRAASWPPARR